MTAPDSGFVEAASVRFSYYPLGLLLVVLLALGIWMLWRWVQRIDPAYERSKIVVLLPGLAGIGIAVALWRTPFIFLGLPLQMSTAAILSWRALRLRSTLLSALVALVVCVVVTSLNLVYSDSATENIERFYDVVFMTGLLCGLPVAFIRLAAFKRIGLPFLIGGALLGILISVLVFWYFWGSPGFPRWAYLFLLIPGAASSLPVILLVRFSPWVRHFIRGKDEEAGRMQGQSQQQMEA